MDQPADRVTPNWLLLSVIVGTAIALGMLPFLAWFGAARWAIATLVVAAIWVPLNVRGFACTATERPRALEWLLAGWSVVGYGAVAGLMGFIWYGLGKAFWWLVVAGADAIHWKIAVQPDTIADYVAGVFVVVMLLGMLAITTDELPGKLYPATAGTRSVFYPLTARHGRLAAFALAIVLAFAGGLALLDWRGLWFTVGATVILFASALPLTTLEVPGRSAPPRLTDARETIRSLLAAAGYKVIENPRTGRPEVDPLIASLDFLAMSGSRGFAVEIKALADPQTAIGWPAASAVRTAAKALQRALRAGETPDAAIEPFLIVVGGSVSDDLKTFADEEGVRLARFDTVDVLRSMVAPGGADRPTRERALDVLGVPAGDDAAPPSLAAGASP